MFLARAEVLLLREQRKEKQSNEESSDEVRASQAKDG